MVLRGSLGGSSFEINESEVVKLEETASIHLPFLFDSFLLWISDSAQTFTGLPIEVLVSQ